jgi:peptide/nickel transport system substrate-binding protein
MSSFPETHSRRPARRQLTAAALAAVAAFALGGCGGTAGAAPTGSGAAPSILVYGTKDGPGVGGLDPFVSTVYSATAIFAQIYEPLVVQDDQGELAPSLAVEWEQTDDLTYSFTLRDGVKFSDGSDLTASDVIWTVEYLKAESPQSKAAALENLESVSETSPGVIEFKFSKPNPSFFGTVADRSYGIFIVDQQWYESADETARQTTSNGTGPFRLESWSKGVDLKLVKNENYWDQPKPYLDGITFKEVGDESSILALAQQGEIDAAWFWEPELADQAVAAGFTLGDLQQTSTRFFFIDPNLGDGSLADVKVRQALSQAIDRAEVVSVGTQGHGAPTFAAPPAFTQLDQPSEATPNYAYSVDGAKALLAQSGNPNPKITLSYDATTADEPALQVIQDQVAKAGITLELNPIPYEQIQAVFTNGDPYPSELILVQDVISSDPSGSYGWWLTTGGNVDRWGDDPQAAQAKSLLETIDTNPNAEERVQQLNELNSLVAEQVLTLTPFATPLNYQVWSSRVTGYQTDPGDSRYHWKDAKLGAAQ